MKKFRKYESDVEELDQELEDIDVDESEDEAEDLEDVDVEEDVDDVDEEVEDYEEAEEANPDSVEFSTEINGVKYSGTLYRSEDQDDEELEDEDDQDDDSEEDEEDDEEDLEDDDLILRGEEELDDLDFPEGMEESVIKANAKIYGKKYNVSFCNVKKESVKRAKIEMRRHNIVEAWNALVRGAKTIKC